jgi:hypothetical protein
MRLTVPTSLSGGSLLDAHKWVKSNMARSNPGGTSDYKLADSVGNPMTLSDLVKPNPATIEVEIISGRSGVRSNPSLPLPTDFTPSPDFARSGNFSNQLLPRDLDPALVERMVAQEGIFGAVNTLTILLSKRSTADEISPATAGLLYAYSAVPRTNPGGKTPFLADASKEMYDSEIMIHRYLNDHGIDNLEKRSQIVGKSKISAKYDLTLARLEQFVKEVLAPFLAISSGNRGAIRTINKISAGFDSEEKKNFVNNFEKLMYLMPTKAEDFYKGREYALAATTEFIYPMRAMSLLTPKEIDTLLGIAGRFPNNLDKNGKQLKLNKKESKLIQNRVMVSKGLWKTILQEIPYFSRFAPTIFKDMTGDSQEAKAKLSRGKVPDDEQLIAHIVEALNLDEFRFSSTKDTNPSKFIFLRDMGGYYPSPPKGWPPMLMYAIMDAFLDALPEIVDIRDPSKNFESKVSMDFLRTLTDESTLVAIDPITSFKDVSFKDYKDTVTKSASDREAYLKGLGVDDTSAAAASATEVTFTNYIFSNWNPSGTTALNTSSELGKSVIELLYDVMELSKGKYNYTMSNDDLTFALIMIDYSIKTLFDDGASIAAPTALMSSIFGVKKTSAATTRYADFVKAVNAGALSPTDAEASVTYLATVQALMDIYFDEAKADTTKKATSLGKSATLRATIASGVTDPLVRNLCDKIIVAMEDEINKL